MRAPVLAAALAFGAGVAIAQPGDGDDVGGPGMMGWPGGGAMMMRHGGCPIGGAGFPDGRAAFLRAELKIAAAQEPQFKALDEAFRKNAEAMRAHRDEMTGDADAARPGAMMERMRERRARMDAPLPERLARHRRMMDLHAQAHARFADAASALYGVLDDAQKKTADRLLAPMCAMF